MLDNTGELTNTTTDKHEGQAGSYMHTTTQTNTGTPKHDDIP